MRQQRQRSRLVLHVAHHNSVDPAANTAEPTETVAEPTEDTPTAESPGLVPHYAGDTDSPLGYYEYLPPSYGDGDPSPLLIFLHGFGMNGDGTEADLDRMLVDDNLPLDLIGAGQRPSDRPFVVLAPQHAFPTNDEPYAPCEEEQYYAIYEWLLSQSRS